MDASTALSQVLELPELLESIFQHLATDKHSLAQAILVNHKWFDCATRVLWSAPRSEVLAAIPDHGRRQLYASNICFLRFDADDSQHHVLYRGLQFPSLKSVTLDSYHPEDGQFHLRQYFQAPLEEFFFYGGPLDEDSLNYMASRCFRLHTLLIDNLDPTQISPLFFLEFLSRLSSIEKMTFMYGMDHLLTQELLVSVASRENLKSFSWGRRLEEGVYQELVNRVPTPFESAEHLRFTIPSSAVPILVRTAGATLRDLSLTVTGDLADVTVHISTLAQLRRLELLLESDVSLGKKDVILLKKLSNLRVLRIGRSDPGSFPTLLDFTDRDFNELVSSLPHLEVLSWEAQCSLSSKSLACLLKHCRSLVAFTFLSGFNVQELEEQVGPNAVFPKVVELEVGGLQASTDATETAQLLGRIFPSVDYLEAGDDAFSTSVMDAWEEMHEE
jgi:hypothetical protein